MLEIKLCRLCEILEKSLVSQRLYEDPKCIVFKHKGLHMIMLKEHNDKLEKEQYETMVDILKDTCGGGKIIGAEENTNHFHIYLVKPD